MYQCVCGLYGQGLCVCVCVCLFGKYMKMPSLKPFGTPLRRRTKLTFGLRYVTLRTTLRKLTCQLNWLEIDFNIDLLPYTRLQTKIAIINTT